MLELHSAVWHHVRTVQWGAMLELHSAVRRHARTAQWGAMLELHSEVGCHVRTAQWGVMLELHCGHHQCATGNPVPVLVDPVDFFRSGSGPVPAKYRPDRPDLTSKFGCRI